MLKAEISHIVSSKWVPKVGKYVVRLGYHGEKAEEVWMTERQLAQLEALFERTPRGYSSERLSVLGVWNDRGYYAYAELQKQRFIEPEQHRLDDLKDD